VPALIRRTRPDAILMHSLHHEYNAVAYATALAHRVPVWIRVETQDEAVERGALKSAVRGLVYRALYAGIGRAFYIGELSREHLLAHGIAPRRLAPARYCTPDPIAALGPDEKTQHRTAMRQELGIDPDAVVVAFVGKLIPKKDPQLLLQALSVPGEALAARVTCLFVGSGEFETALRVQAARLLATAGIDSVFAGFVNQSQLWRHYLASDIVVLPSRRMGETWGLVVNEALQAGCRVVVTRGVGSHRDFGNWPGVRVIDVGDARGLRRALGELAPMERQFNWARDRLEPYGIEASARAWHAALNAESPDAGVDASELVALPTDRS
jgi:glycosyltransferase involved in cell wall biosynthesis